MKLELNKDNLNTLIASYPCSLTYNGTNQIVSILTLVFSVLMSASLCGAIMYVASNMVLFKAFHFIPAPIHYMPCFIVCMYPNMAQITYKIGFILILFAWAMGTI